MEKAYNRLVKKDHFGTLLNQILQRLSPDQRLSKELTAEFFGFLLIEHSHFVYMFEETVIYYMEKYERYRLQFQEQYENSKSYREILNNWLNDPLLPGLQELLKDRDPKQIDTLLAYVRNTFGVDYAKVK